MTHSPLFTVILPTHNRAHLLKRAMTSLLAQTCSDFELMIIDDGSTDSTQTLINTYNDPRIHVIHIPIAKGVSHARNQGILKARGKYIAFLDDDDEYLPQFLEKTQQALHDSPNGAVFSWCGIQRVFPNKKPENQLWDLSEKQHHQDLKFAVQFSISHGFTIERSILLDVELFDERMSASEDIDLLLRLLDKGYNYLAISAVLIRLHIHQGPSLSRTQSQLRFAISNQRLVDKNAAFLHRHPRLWLHYCGTLAGNYYRTHQPDKARKIMLSMLKKFPFHVKTWDRLFRFEIIEKIKKSTKKHQQ